MNRTLRNILLSIGVIVIVNVIASASSNKPTIESVTSELEVKQNRLSLIQDSKAQLHEAANSLRALSYEESHEAISKLGETWSELNEEEGILTDSVAELSATKSRLEAEKAEKERIAAEKAAREKARGKYLGTFETTAYCHGSKTSTGVAPKVGTTIAVDPKVIPYGSKLRLVRKDTGEEIGIRIAQDCGGAIKGKRLDIFLGSESECRNWGRKNLDVYLID